MYRPPMMTETAAAASVPQTAPRRASRPGRIAAHCWEDQSRSLRHQVLLVGGGGEFSGSEAGGRAARLSVAIDHSCGAEVRGCELTALYMELVVSRR